MESDSPRSGSRRCQGPETESAPREPGRELAGQEQSNLGQGGGKGWEGSRTPTACEWRPSFILTRERLIEF